jgi:flagellum-specific peptidoglycan hydrolase FlgJ
LKHFVLILFFDAVSNQPLLFYFFLISNFLFFTIMGNNNSNPQANRFPAVLRQSLNHYFFKLKHFSSRPSIRFAVLCLLAYVLLQKDFSFSISFGKTPSTADAMTTSVVSVPQALPARYEEPKTELKPQKNEPQIYKSNKISSKPTAEKAKFINQTPKHWWETARLHSHKTNLTQTKPTVNNNVDDLNLANPATAVSSALTDEQKKKAASYSNLGFILNPDFAERKNIDLEIVKAKNQVCFDYISKFTAIAQEEARQYNIPASITIAQGLLESNAGESNLAKKDHNHFGIKCRSQCVGCRCANYTDDSRFDMFRIFESDAQSFREHSLLLTGSRYKHLLNLPRSDYQNWAHGLKTAGYATDAKYASKLIAIIEALQLYKLDL